MQINSISSEPCPQVADKVQYFYNNKLLGSLSKIFHLSRKIYDDEFEHVPAMLLSIEKNRKLAPELYYRYFNILDAIERDDAKVLQHAFHQLPGKDLYRESVHISALTENEWQHLAAKRYESDVAIKEYKHPVKFHCLSSHEFSKYKPCVERSLQIIKLIDADLYHEVDNFLGEISLLCEKTVVGISAPEHFGLVFISTPKNETEEINPELYFIEHITHETSHLFLHAVSAMDVLILNSPEEIFPAPIRRDLRPIYGIYHATFVLSRMVRVFRKILATADLSINYDVAAMMLRDFERKFESGYGVLERNAKFTELGKEIFLSTRHCAYES